MGYFHEVEDTDKLENGWKHKYYVLFEEYKHEKQRLMDKADYDARCLKEMDDKLEAAYKALRRERDRVLELEAGDGSRSTVEARVEALENALSGIADQIRR